MGAVTTHEPSSARAAAHPDGAHPYQLFILVLSVWALLILAARAFGRLDAATRTILDYADNAVCVLFLLDFLNSFIRAPRKMHYMLTWGWIDLLSSIPAIDALRLGRAARVVRILRVLRMVRSARLIAQFVLKRRAESAFLAAALLSLLLIVCCSIAILQFEVAAGGNIANAQDAMWWAATTMTTVGYGDKYPVTAEGRVVAVFLMVAGVGVFGTFSGLVASWFLSSAAQQTDSDLTEIKALLLEMRQREVGAPPLE
jgi:voltage-gated potassium channel